MRAFIVLLLLATATAQAYIPKFWMIMSRTAENHGRGFYLLDQNVVFTHADRPLVVHEQWLIEGENRLRLRVYGKQGLKGKVQLTRVYNGRLKSFVDENGVRKSQKVSSDWFEPYFFFRFSKNIKPLMVAQKMIPPSGAQPPKRIYSLKDLSHDPEPFLRIGRMDGVFSYAIGTPTPVDKKDHPLPGLWIEQDAFVIQKVRLPSQVTVKAEGYDRFSRNFYFPKKRALVWGNHSIEFQTTRVKPLPTTNKLKERFSPKSLDYGKEPTLATKLPDDEIIKEFYSRFR